MLRAVWGAGYNSGLWKSPAAVVSRRGLVVCLDRGGFGGPAGLVPWGCLDRRLGVCSGSGCYLDAVVGVGPALVGGRTVAMVANAADVGLLPVGCPIVREA